MSDNGMVRPIVRKNILLSEITQTSDNADNGLTMPLSEKTGDFDTMMRIFIASDNADNEYRDLLKKKKRREVAKYRPMPDVWRDVTGDIMI